MGFSAGFALAAGIAAAFNPCGAAMLPGYVGFLLRDGKTSLWRGLLIGLAMTAGFVATFALAALLVQLAAQVVAQLVPWVALAIGLSLVVIGIANLSGRHMGESGTFLRLSERLNPSQQGSFLRTFFVYGVAYALASLGCTLPLFLALVGQSLRAGGFMAAAPLFLAYAVGMGLVATALATGAQLSRLALSRLLQQAMPYVQRAAGALTLGAGLYISWYWLAGPGSVLR